MNCFLFEFINMIHDFQKQVLSALFCIFIHSFTHVTLGCDDCFITLITRDLVATYFYFF